MSLAVASAYAYAWNMTNEPDSVYLFFVWSGSYMFSQRKRLSASMLDDTANTSTLALRSLYWQVNYPALRYRGSSLRKFIAPAYKDMHVMSVHMLEL